MNETVFCSVIFPANLPYFEDFIRSLENQTDTAFTLLLFNDGIAELEDYLKNTSLNYQLVKIQGSIPQTRTYVLSFLKHSHFSKIIFGDTDDYFSENRVEVCKKLLEDYDIVANDLVLVSQNKTVLGDLFWKNRKEVAQPINLASITHYNFLGLGNTAINRNVLPEQISFNSDLIAIDWFLFSVILQSDVKVVFSSESHVFYRQHDANSIGRKTMTFADFKKGITIKLNHYRTLALHNPDFKVLANQYEAFMPQLTADYFNEISKQKIENPFWWEEIQL
ncbi:hypothetical protein [Flavobacterium sp.]|uniref:hypothetical protein n=1 Tax=Flavobacterium sp. TaxID=239 RepID=UPI00261ECD33|nr:hypothetical protein [Flavobacterium sp.]MDD2986292.1 hypothetical protein [Flavobacterium sp.]